MVAAAGADVGDGAARLDLSGGSSFDEFSSFSRSGRSSQPAPKWLITWAISGPCRTFRCRRGRAPCGFRSEVFHPFPAGTRRLKSGQRRKEGKAVEKCRSARDGKNRKISWTNSFSPKGLNRTYITSSGYPIPFRLRAQGALARPAEMRSRNAAFDGNCPSFCTSVSMAATGV